MSFTARALVVLLVAAVPASGFTCTGFNPVQDPAPLGKQELFAAAGAQHASQPRELSGHAGHDHGTARRTEHAHALVQRRAPTSAAPALTFAPFKLDEVTLTPRSMLGEKRQRDLDYLLSDALAPDSVLFNFRNASGLPQPQGAKPWGGWEDPNCLLRGHFSGHWLSATAMMYNATGNVALKARIDYVLEQLVLVAAAQSTGNGCGSTRVPCAGYLSGFPATQFDDLEDQVPYPQQWSPYYTVHKIEAGLRDQYLYAGSQAALTLLEGLAAYFRSRIDAVIARGTYALWAAIMNQEFGGQNEVMYDLYAITGKTEYMETAHLFDKPCFLGPLALGADDLNTMHANAHEPIVVGAARRYELTGDASYAAVTANFHDVLTHSHSFATGSGNHGEYWQDPHRMGDALDGDTEETCTSYNALKIDRHLMSWTGDVGIADHYEKLFTNGILPTQRPRDTFGQYIYMLPLSFVNGSSKGWGDPVYSMTCCFGTGIENFAKTTDSIFFHADGAAPSPQLFIVQYHTAAVTWSAPAFGAGVSLAVAQAAEWNATRGSVGALSSTLVTTVAGAASVSATITLRVPSWAQAGSTLTLNGAPWPGAGSLASLTWVNVTRVWASGDALVLTVPMALRSEVIDDDRASFANVAAVLVGPFLLVAPAPSSPAPWSGNGTLNGDMTSLASWITPLTPAERAWTSLALGNNGSGTFLAADPGMLTATTMQVQPLAQGTQDQDTTVTVDSPGLTGVAGTVSVQLTAYPGFYLCATSGAQGASLSFVNAPAPARASQCSFVSHSPSVSGVPGTVSLEIASTVGLYVSAFGGSVTLQAVQAGGAWANASSWYAGAPNNPSPVFAFRAHAAAGSDGRDYLLFPIADADTAPYVAYFPFVN
jgi:DUF1680 family protein